MWCKTYIKDDSYWKNHIYSTSELPDPADHLDCSFLCRNVEKPNGCDLFLFEVRKNLLRYFIHENLNNLIEYIFRTKYVIWAKLRIQEEILTLY